MAGLFISYRRDDSQGYAGRLAQDLSQALGEHRVFSDVEIPPGHDFSAVLHRAIAASDVLLVVIGRRWAATSAQGFASRLFEPDDWVRAEIEAALALGKPVIPLLVGGAAMPAPETLPATLQPLTRLQALSMNDRHWQADLALLLLQLHVLVPGLPQDAGVPANHADTPAQALGELARLLREQLDQRTRSSDAAPAAGRPPPRLLGWLARQMRGWLSAAAVLVVVYLGLRLFADAQTLAQLDSLEARLLTAWQRLRAHAP